MSNLVVVNVRDTSDRYKDQYEIRVFNEDTELLELDKYISENRQKGNEVHEMLLYGDAVEPLRQYFQDHPMI